jgi:tetratricopeptide (TPR) repeat protein
MRSLLTALLVLALAAAPASAAKIKLKGGKVVDCKVLAYDSPSKTLRVRLESGQEEQYTMDQLDARSAYLVNASLVPKDDAQALLQVANFARDAGLYVHAVRRYEQAAKLDAGLKPTIEKEMVALKRSAAAFCADQARAAAAKGDFKEAEKWAKILIQKLPDEPEAAEASRRLDDYYARNRAEAVAAADAKATDAIQKDVATGKKKFEQMVEKSKQGLQAKGNSEAESHFRNAIADGKAVLKEIDRVEKKYTDPALQEKIASYRQIANDQLIEVYMNLASRQCVQSDYNGATQTVGQALAIDPKNEAALSMRARIEDYSSRGLDWGRPWI